MALALLIYTKYLLFKNAYSETILHMKHIHEVYLRIGGIKRKETMNLVWLFFAKVCKKKNETKTKTTAMVERK